MLHQIVSGHDFNKEMTEVVTIMDSTFEQLGVSALKSCTTIEFNHRFQRRAGDAKLTRRYLGNSSYVTTGKIRLGTKYFSVASEKDKMQTVVHEACHIANHYLYYEDSDWRQFHYDVKQERATDGHGPSWITLMNRMNVPAERFHCMDTVQFKTYFKYSCPCEQWSFNFTAQRAGRQRNGTSMYVCPKCRKYVSPDRLIKIDGAELTYGTV